MASSRKQFCQNLNTNSDAFQAKQSQTHHEIADLTTILLTINKWDQNKLTQFSTLCRLLLNFALKRIVIIINNTDFDSISNQITDNIFNDPNFTSISRIKQPKTSVIIDKIHKKHLKVPITYLLNRYSIQSTDNHKLQITIVHTDSFSMRFLKLVSSSKNKSLMYHHLCNANSLTAQLITLKTLNTVLKQTNPTNDTVLHIFHTQFDTISNQNKLSLMSFLTFLFYTYRTHISLHKNNDKTEQKYNENDFKDNRNKNIHSECIPVLYEWKTAYNIGRVIHLLKMFKIPILIHLFDEKKFNLYNNQSFMSKMAECCAKNVDEMKCMIDIKMVNDEQMALKIINSQFDKKSKNKSCLLIMNQNIFLKLLGMDKERSLVIMETVNFENKTPPICVDEFVKKSYGNDLKWYGIVGRENYGIKPKYLYDLYKIYNNVEKEVMDSKGICQVVYVNTSKILPSLNASTAMSLLIWANYSLCV